MNIRVLFSQKSRLRLGAMLAIVLSACAHFDQPEKLAAIISGFVGDVERAHAGK